MMTTSAKTPNHRLLRWTASFAATLMMANTALAQPAPSTSPSQATSASAPPPAPMPLVAAGIPDPAVGTTPSGGEWIVSSRGK